MYIHTCVLMYMCVCLLVRATKHTSSNICSDDAFAQPSGSKANANTPKRHATFHSAWAHTVLTARKHNCNNSKSEKRKKNSSANKRNKNSRLAQCKLEISLKQIVVVIFFFCICVCFYAYIAFYLSMYYLFLT